MTRRSCFLATVVLLLIAPFALVAQSGESPGDTEGNESGGEVAISDISIEEVLADFDMVWETISAEYVDPGYGGVDWDSLKSEYRSKVATSEKTEDAYRLISDLLGELGNEMTFVVPPWLRPMEVLAAEEEASEEIELEYAGVGILLQQMQSGEVWVLSVFREAPAERAGVLVGDVITGVDEWRVEGEDAVSGISSRVRGPVGTDVTLTLKAPDDTEREVTITRATIDLRPSVEFRRVEGSIGYLRIPALTDELVQEASKALPQLLSMRYLILDLRNVYAGTIEGMTQVAQWFLGAASLGGLVYREGGVQLPFRQDAIAAYQRPLAILVNSGTYGVGEMLAKSLRDYKRGPLVGNQTEGGFQVSKPVELPSGGLLNMTIGLYVSPANELLPYRGLEPDTVVEVPDLEVVRSGRDVYIESAVEAVRSNPRL